MCIRDSINIGYGNTVNSDRVVAAVSADAAPVKRIISAAKDNNTAIDANFLVFQKMIVSIFCFFMRFLIFNKITLKSGHLVFPK